MIAIDKKMSVVRSIRAVPFKKDSKYRVTVSNYGCLYCYFRPTKL